jgi:ABC-type uncharacterized transport system substrate-binding protein
MKKAGWASALVAVTLLAVAVVAEAQQPAKIPRIGYLSITDAATDSPRAEGIRLALREIGYIEGQNIAIEYRYAEGKNDRLPGLATLKLTIQPWEIRAVDDFEKVFAALNKQRPDGLYVIIGGGVMRPNLKRIAGFALKSRLPSVYDNKEAVDAGGLMSYGADLAASYRRVAYYIDKILKGAKPADLPVEQPTKFDLAINLKTAKQIGVTIPQSLLYRADKVIK